MRSGRRREARRAGRHPVGRPRVGARLRRAARRAWRRRRAPVRNRRRGRAEPALRGSAPSCRGSRAALCARPSGATDPRRRRQGAEALSSKGPFPLARGSRSARFRPMDDDTVQVATVAVIGDVHLFWDEADVAFFNGCGYDLVLFVGDLSGYTQLRGRGVARLLRKLRVPAMLHSRQSRRPPRIPARRGNRTARTPTSERVLPTVRPVAARASSVRWATSSSSDTAGAASRPPAFH